MTLADLHNVLKEINNKYIFLAIKESWGYAVLFMEKNGKAFSRLYWYDDDDSTCYLDWLSVDEDARGQGLGTEMQEIRENIGKRLGASTSCLWVRKGTWMHDWYIRRGYEDWINNDNEENSIWMKKSLK